MKVKLTADLFIDEIYNIDDNLNEDEISEKFWNCIVEQIVWNWEKVDDKSNVTMDEMSIVTAKKFINSTQEDKHNLIECAINKDEKYEFTQNCLLAMLAEQRKEIRNAYDDFFEEYWD